MLHTIFTSKKMSFSVMFFVGSSACALTESSALIKPTQQTSVSLSHVTHQAHVSQFNSLMPLMQHLAAQPNASENIVQMYHAFTQGLHELSILQILQVLPELIEGINSLVQPGINTHNATVVPALNNMQKLSTALHNLSTKHTSTDLKIVYQALDEYIVSVHKLIMHVA